MLSLSLELLLSIPGEPPDLARSLEMHSTLWTKRGVECVSVSATFALFCITWQRAHASQQEFSCPRARHTDPDPDDRAPRARRVAPAPRARSQLCARRHARCASASLSAMDGARSVDLDDPAEHVPAIRGKKSRLFAARHVRLATDDLSEDDDADTADAGMPPARLTYKEKMARARAMFSSKSAGECAADGSLESPPGKGALMAELDRHDSPGPLHRRLRSLSRAVHEAFTLARSSPIAALNAFAESRTGRLVLLVFVALCSLAVLLRRSSQPLASPPPSAFVVRPRHPSSPHIPRAVPQGVSSGLDLGSPRPPPPLQESVSPPKPRPRPPAPPPPPHRSPPPLSPTALLNARYLHGQSSNDTAAAGILIHQLDGIDLGDLRDDFGRLKKPWMPCPQTGMTWCSDIGDRMSASIINARLPHLFSDVAAGFIVNPQAEILCSFPKDGGTMPYKCTADERGREAGCVPGCYGPGRLRTRCDNLIKGCYDPEHVQNMLEDQAHVPPDRCDRCSQGNGCRYNEVRRPTVGLPAQKRLVRKGTPP